MFYDSLGKLWPWCLMIFRTCGALRIHFFLVPPVALAADIFRPFGAPQYIKPISISIL